MLSFTMISFPSSRRHVTLEERADIIYSMANHFVIRTDRAAYVWVRITAGSAMNQNIEIRTEWIMPRISKYVHVYVIFRQFGEESRRKRTNLIINERDQSRVRS